jgi:mannose-1-phosphate guanylyltransferase
MLHAVIMAGGAGTRFWPESRADRPKQLLRLAGDETMLERTVARLGDVVPRERVQILTGARLVEPISEQLPRLPKDSILAEPCKRDTAPCIGLAAFHLTRRDADATMAVMPSDHVISTDEVFQRSLLAAAELVEDQPQRIVTFGVRPTYAAESFGYIERGESFAPPCSASELNVYRVQRFREKPRAELAREFLAAGSFYWNSGIFVWKAQTILDALAQHEPEMHRRLATIAAAIATPGYQSILEREFAAIGGKSIDYAVMEHARDVLVIEAPFQWDDVGSWQAIARLSQSDEHGNTVNAKHLGLNTTGTIVRDLASGENQPSPGARDDHLIVTLGLSDCIIVRTPDATLIARKEDEESIRQVVKLLEERGWKQYL